MITNITEKQALDYIQDYANSNFDGQFLETMIYIKENISNIDDIKLRVCFAVAFNGFQNFFAEPEAA